MSRSRRFYTKEFKEKVLSAYNDSDESASEVSRRFGVSLDTVKSWVYRQWPSVSSCSVKSVKFAESDTHLMRKQKEQPHGFLEVRIRELEQQLVMEKMRSESLSKMIEIAERELKINIRKKSGAKQSLR